MRNALRPAMDRLRADLHDPELWCLCIIGALLWLAN
jgi:hypothetical protein